MITEQNEEKAKFKTLYNQKLLIQTFGINEMQTK